MNAPAASPLEELGSLLEDDMKAVNAKIIKRMDSPVAMIPQLASYLIAAGGKRVRPLLTLASTKIYGGEMSRAHNLSTAVEFIHTATLLHDDVVDESEERGKVKAGETARVDENEFTVDTPLQTEGDLVHHRAAAEQQCTCSSVNQNT